MKCINSANNHIYPWSRLIANTVHWRYSDGIRCNIVRTKSKRPIKRLAILAGRYYFCIVIQKTRL